MEDSNEENDKLSDIKSTEFGRSINHPEHSSLFLKRNYGTIQEIIESGDMGLSGNSFRNFASKLGFGIRSILSDPAASPLTLGLIDVMPDEEQSAPIGYGTAPLVPSSYQRRMSLMSSNHSQWAMNYKEAVIYLEEGKNNEEFRSHPKRSESLPAYLLAHTKWFHLTDFLASFLLLTLPIVENPAAFQIPAYAHGIVELILLLYITMVMIIRIRWLGFRESMKHLRTLAKTLLIVVMIVETIVLIARNEPHFRITRALRPLFILDNQYFKTVRRFSREVVKCLPPIIDMLILLFFIIFIFSLLGQFLFSHDPNNMFFTTLDDTFVNLFVLLTTANYPDIMMQSYYNSPWNVFYFVAYLIICLYFFMNLLLAVVYDNFTTLEKEKFQKLFLHKRTACQKAFDLLVSRSNANGIIFRHFCGIVMLYDPKKSLRDIYLMFRALDESKDGYLNSEEFCRFYEVNALKWEPLLTVPQRPWKRFKNIGIALLKFLNSKYSDHLFNSLIVLNTAMMGYHWIRDDDPNNYDGAIFALIFTIEMGLKLSTWGSHRLLTSGWHIFDLLSTISYVLTLLIVEYSGGAYGELLNFTRPLRILRIFKMKKRYRDVLGTLFILYRPMFLASIVILLLYFSFAIVGMEIFSGVDLRNCCTGTLIESYFTVPPTETSFGLRFYINTFTNIFRSYVTLFELTVVNNWYVIMEGHSIATSKWARIYFFVFYLSTMILLNIIVAFILDTFLYRMRYKRRLTKKTEEKLFRKDVFLNCDEINFVYHQTFQNRASLQLLVENYGRDLVKDGGITFVGKGRRTKEILYKRICSTEADDWVKN